MNSDTTLTLAISRVRGISLRGKLRLAAELQSPGDFSALSKERLERILKRRTRIRTWKPGEWLEAAELDQKGLTTGDFKCTFYGGLDYPSLLTQIHDPPYVLYYRGELPKAAIPPIAVVGTRKPSGIARKAAFGFGLDVGRYGVPVVSGLARGIDVSAHLGNTAAGAGSVGVLGCGIDRIYPLSSVHGARQILATGGCILSEYGIGVPPMRYHFPERNRIISGLSRAVVVVEAPAKSGALITADFALEQGRDLYVHKGVLGTGQNEGCRNLAFDGAPAVSSAFEILRDWGFDPKQAGGRRTLDRADQSELLEREIKGELVTYAGEYFEKD